MYFPKIRKLDNVAMKFFSKISCFFGLFFVRVGLSLSCCSLCARQHAHWERCGVCGDNILKSETNTRKLLVNYTQTTVDESTISGPKIYNNYIDYKLKRGLFSIQSRLLPCTRDVCGGFVQFVEINGL